MIGAVLCRVSARLVLALSPRHSTHSCCVARCPGSSKINLPVLCLLFGACTTPGTIGFRGSDVFKAASRRCMLTQGAAETDETLRVVSHSRVFALGDVSGVKSVPETDSLPITAQVCAAPAVRDEVCRLTIAPCDLAWHVPFRCASQATR